MRGTLLVAGTHSDAGKSVVVAGICRWLAREGVRVAPFKAQNMALNSFVTREGAEIGRAQAAQAAAARVQPEAAMNPVLLKPSARDTQVIVRGRPWATASARSYQGMKKDLLPVVLESLEYLQNRYDVVVCEGAGSPAEINLRPYDLANMGLARSAEIPVILVGDIDRGGLFASLYGTLALLSAEDQALVSGFLINKFRGDQAVLAPGLEEFSRLTGRPFSGRCLTWWGSGSTAKTRSPSTRREKPGLRSGGTSCGSLSRGLAGSATSPTSTPLLTSPASSSPLLPRQQRCSPPTSR